MSVRPGRWPGWVRSRHCAPRGQVILTTGFVSKKSDHSTDETDIKWLRFASSRGMPIYGREGPFLGLEGLAETGSFSESFSCQRP